MELPSFGKQEVSKGLPYENPADESAQLGRQQSGNDSGEAKSCSERLAELLYKIQYVGSKVYNGLPEQKAGEMGSVQIQTIPWTLETCTGLAERIVKKRAQNVCTLGSGMDSIR